MPREWLLLLALAGCGADTDQVPDLGPPPSPDPSMTSAVHTGVNPRLIRRFPPLEARIGDPAPEALVDLGRMLFFDERLSADGDISCNTCHDLARSGVDSKRVSIGRNGQAGTRNAPTVYNAAGHLAQFWDGRAVDVEEQALLPIVNPLEMGMPRGDDVVALLAGLPGYVAAFQDAFPDDHEPIRFENVGVAIGAFERGLVTPSRWDAFVEGDPSALTTEEIDGFKLFADIGCAQCHTGRYVGGSMFQRAGAAIPWPDGPDRGRRAVTGLEADDLQFKVPSLRNVAETAPYFHDGSAATLDEAIRKMAHHQLGLELDPAEVASIEAWLGCLTGTAPAEYTLRPALP